MTSLWCAGRDEAPQTVSNLDEPGSSVDVAVVGAGITGMITALLLARAGRSVVVLEARSVGACTTGNTTGKISLLQGTKLSKIVDRHGPDVARAYVQGNREGQEWLLSHCEEQHVPVQREDAYTYAQSPEGVAAVLAELAACHATGLAAEWDDDPRVPFPYYGGVRLGRQAQFDPMPFLDSMVRQVEENGGRVVQGVRVRTVSSRGDRVRLHVHPNGGGQDVDVDADKCVLATGIPILDRGGYFARVKPNRSYCLAYSVPGEITRPMFISADSPTRSVRYALVTEGERLIVGGAGHVVGRQSRPADALKELSSWAQSHYPGAVLTHQWSAQDYTPIDDLPYAGPILPNNEKLYIATGFDKWGMAAGAAAALALAGGILGRRTEWAPAFASWSRHELSGLATGLRANLEVAYQMARGWTIPVIGPSHVDGASVGGPPWRPEARCAVDGVEHRVSAVCTHLGGIVNWNDADKAWECPLHGSRFAPDGTLLEGPATHDLSPRG